MRIGFEASGVITNNPTGIAHYISKLISAISSEIEDNDALAVFYKLSRSGKRFNWWKPENLNVKNYYKSYWPIDKGVDIIHGLDGYVPYWNNVKSVVTIHDLLALKSGNENIAPKKFVLKKEKVYKKILEYADSVITCSEATKRDVIKMLDVSPDKVNVIYHGIDECYSPQNEAAINRVMNKYELKKEYLLFVGAISKRKNTERLVHAFSRSEVSRDLDLVLAGTISYQGEKTLQAITKYNLDDKVKVLGYVETSDLPALYSGAAGFVFPTFYEGFGFPILEAMACGTPVLAGNAGAAPEISGNFVLHVDPLNTDEIAHGIDSLTAIPQERIEQGIKYAGSFTWKHCARQTLDIYRGLLQ